MSEKLRKILVMAAGVLVISAATVISGCRANISGTESDRMVEYTVICGDEIPEEFKKQINENKAKAMKLMASKLAVAGLIEGTFSEEGLAAMSDVQDMTSQMAKELMLGIKDNVEDIAATFKKMAIINPHRAVKQLPKPITVQKERVVEVPQPESVRAADTAARQVLYDGLLQASRTGRKPKHTELEDQLSMFDTAA